MTKVYSVSLRWFIAYLSWSSIQRWILWSKWWSSLSHLGPSISYSTLLLYVVDKQFWLAVHITMECVNSYSDAWSAYRQMKQWDDKVVSPSKVLPVPNHGVFYLPEDEASRARHPLSLCHKRLTGGWDFAVIQTRDLPWKLIVKKRVSVIWS